MMTTTPKTVMVVLHNVKLSLDFTAKVVTPHIKIPAIPFVEMVLEQAKKCAMITILKIKMVVLQIA